jgi:hypothetical protein
LRSRESRRQCIDEFLFGWHFHPYSFHKPH